MNRQKVINKFFNSKKLNRYMTVLLAAVISLAFILPVSSYAEFYTNSNGDCFYKDEDGSNATGFRKIDGYWYYFNKDDGVMFKDRIETINNSVYRFLSDGKAYTGWYEDGQDVFYFKNDGKISSGWTKIENKNFYFSEKDYKMCTGERYIDGLIYTFNSAGVWNGKAGVKANDFRKLNWSENVASVSKKEVIFQKINDDSYYTVDQTIGNYQYRTYFSFENGKLYSGQYIIDDEAPCISNGYSCYSAFEQILDTFSNKYGSPETDGFKYFGVMSDYAQNKLTVYDSVALGYADYTADWYTNTTRITLKYYADDDTTPIVSVTYTDITHR